MTEKLLLPKFLTQNVAKIAVAQVFGAVFGDQMFADMLSRKMGHVVIMVPAMKDERAEDYPSWPNYPLQPHVLYEQSEGSPEDWPYDFANIARCKALQLWHERNDDRTDCMPHLLFPGDTPFCGGVKRHGIVGAFSGVQPHFDKMISGMTIDMWTCVSLLRTKGGSTVTTRKRPTEKNVSSPEFYLDRIKGDVVIPKAALHEGGHSFFI